MTDNNQRNKEVVGNYWQRLNGAPTTDYLQAASEAMAPDVRWHGHAPVGSHQGPGAFATEVWGPLLTSFPDLERETFVFFGGRSNGRQDGDVSLDGHMWVTGTGVMRATFAHDYLSIPATGQPVELRWGEFCRLDGYKITETYFLLDMVDLMQQAGVDPLRPSKGRSGTYPPPERGDGVLRKPQDPVISVRSLDHIRSFIFDGLNEYDQDDLSSMGMANFFHPEVQWYGPGGIGWCDGLSEFEELHQRPWLVAYPDRQVQDLDALVAEGPYSGAPGWAGVRATHTGRYLGVEPTGKAIEFNGLDWWKRDGEQYIENWVFVDMVHLFAQFGIDLMSRMEAIAAGRA